MRRVILTKVNQMNIDRNDITKIQLRTDLIESLHADDSGEDSPGCWVVTNKNSIYVRESFSKVCDLINLAERNLVSP